MEKSWLAFALLLTGCSGDWIDAPQACQGAWTAIAFADMSNAVKRAMNGEPTPERNPNLREWVEEVIQKEKLEGELATEARTRIDKLVAQGARAVCGNVGKSYTGDWECTADQQRVKCK